MNKLPEIYKCDNEHFETHNNTIYYCNTKTSIKKESFDVNLFLNNLKKENGYIFNKKLSIKTLNDSYIGYIIYYDNNYIYLDNNKSIKKDEIIKVEKI